MPREHQETYLAADNAPPCSKLESFSPLKALSIDALEPKYSVMNGQAQEKVVTRRNPFCEVPFQRQAYLGKMTTARLRHPNGASPTMSVI